MNDAPPKKTKLLELLSYEGPHLSESFRRASIEGRGTPQEIADFRENEFRAFITRYFPFPHRVAKGNIVDAVGNESQSIDCIVVNPAHPYTIDAYSKFTVILADGVDLAIEIKPDISDLNELHRGLRQVQSVKKLLRSNPLNVVPTASPVARDFGKRIPCFIFADKAKAKAIETAKEVASYYKENEVPLHEQIDAIAINQVGIIANYKFPEAARHRLDNGTPVVGLIYEHWQDLTIAAFLLHLNSVPPAIMPIAAPLLINYLQGIRHFLAVGVGFDYHLPPPEIQAMMKLTPQELHELMKVLPVADSNDPKTPT